MHFLFTDFVVFHIQIDFLFRLLDASNSKEIEQKQLEILVFYS